MRQSLLDFVFVLFDFPPRGLYCSASLDLSIQRAYSFRHTFGFDVFIYSTCHRHFIFSSWYGWQLDPANATTLIGAREPVSHGPSDPPPGSRSNA